MQLLIMIDMQNDFTTGVLGNQDTAAVVKEVCKEIEDYKASGSPVPIVYTMDSHNNNYMDTQEGKNLPVPHCIVGTDGWQLPNEIEVALEDINTIMVMKETFGAKDLPHAVDVILKDYPIDSIKLMGVCTDICVISNAMLLKAFFPEIPIIIKKSVCAGVTPESAEVACAAMQSCQFIIE